MKNYRGAQRFDCYLARGFVATRNDEEKNQCNPSEGSVSTIPCLPSLAAVHTHYALERSVPPAEEG